MDRRKFLKNLGLICAGLAIVPQLPTVGQATVDPIPVPNKAYSEDRRVKFGYKGALYRVRRDTDNMEINVFPEDIGTDEAFEPLKEWIGGANIYVVACYDQSGRNYHLVEPSAATQMKGEAVADKIEFKTDDATLYRVAPN